MCKYMYELLKLHRIPCQNTVVSDAVILQPTRQAIERAAGALRKGSLVGMPTETVYGLAARVFDDMAVAHVFEVKARPSFDPLIVHVAIPRGSGESTFSWVNYLAQIGVIDNEKLSLAACDRLETLASKYWPGPLTLVLPKAQAVPDLVTSGLTHVAVRVPAHEVAQSLLFELGEPLAAPSANRFGRLSPTSAQDVVTELGDRVAYVLDGGPCRVGVESTVARIDDSGQVFVLRPGAIGGEALGATTGTSVFRPGIAEAPGLCSSHYAPETGLSLVARVSSKSLSGFTHKKIGFLFPVEPTYEELKSIELLRADQKIWRSLSRKGDPVESARNLFRFLRELDQLGLDHIVAVAPEGQTALEVAIRDRLSRASANREEQVH